mmetsp:Transcript_55363/g.123754  ORF Transcript_55363/g.123754 Transcript_55363/m.123754 type:complete len:203 (+) Transcript_55363:1382-1990(+)
MTMITRLTRSTRLASARARTWVADVDDMAKLAHMAILVPPCVYLWCRLTASSTAPPPPTRTPLRRVQGRRGGSVRAGVALQVHAGLPMMAHSRKSLVALGGAGGHQGAGCQYEGNISCAARALLVGCSREHPRLIWDQAKSSAPSNQMPDAEIDRVARCLSSVGTYSSPSTVHSALGRSRHRDLRVFAVPGLLGFWVLCDQR